MRKLKVAQLSALSIHVYVLNIQNLMLVLIIHNSDWVKKINKDVTLKTVTFQCIHILKKDKNVW